jgi:formylglycine-generating enzyme required for sulfatase activity
MHERHLCYLREIRPFPLRRLCTSMSSLAELPELVGFFSYSRKDDEYSQGALSKLRVGIYNELRLQLGRDFRLWQDTAAIPQGALWEDEIVRAISESVFFIPIVTPSAVASIHCRFEFESFLKRERALGRKDLVFPILYVRVPALDTEQVWREDELLRVIGTRQYLDWQKFRFRDLASTDVAERVENFCNHVLKALRQPWTTPQDDVCQQETEAKRIAEDNQRREEAKRLADQEERRKKAEAEAQARAEEERRQRDAAARRRAEEEERRKQAEAQARETALQEERRQQEAEARRRADEEALRQRDAEAKRHAEEEERRKQSEAQAREAAQEERRRHQETDARRRAEQEARRRPVDAKPTPVSFAALSSARERALQPGDSFRESAIGPEMVVVAAGEFMMGSPSSEAGRYDNEAPQHQVTFARAFAVSRFVVTFDDWDACVANGGCKGYRPPDQGWGRGRRPVINVSWNDAKAYAAWLATMTGKPYRLLSEAEYEYAARAGTQTAYPWSDGAGKGNANCNGCGSGWDNKQTAPVGSFDPNPFGLAEMQGNVWEWIEDCWHDTYKGAPDTGAPWTEGDYRNHRVVRGGSWSSFPQMLRSAARNRFAADRRDVNLGFRVARTLEG